METKSKMTKTKTKKDASAIPSTATDDKKTPKNTQAPRPNPDQAGRGRGRGANTNNSVSLVGSRLVKGPDGSSLVVDKEGNILSTLYQEPEPTAPGQFEDAEGFKLSAGQIRKAKRLANRADLEKEHAAFFEEGGSHKMLSMILNKAKQSTGQPKPNKNQPPAQGGRGTQGSGPSGNKRKRSLNQTPTGVTPLAKNKKKNSPAQDPPKEGSYAAATKKHADRQRNAQREKREQEVNPYLLHVHTGKKERGPMNKATFDLFRKELTTKVLENAASSKPFVLRVSHTNWSPFKSAGVIACLDETTSTWYKEIVDTIELDTGVQFRTWQSPERQVGKATLTARGLDITPEQAVSMIKASNPELKGGVSTTSSEVTHTTKAGDKIIEILLSDEAAAILGTRDPKWTLHLGMSTHTVRYQGVMDLAKRLHEGGHELAELFRTTALTDKAEETTETTEAMDIERAAEEASGSGLDSPEDLYARLSTTPPLQT
jgi:hypothetical protein